MAKLCPTGTFDAMLDYIALSNEMVVCSASPTTFAEAHTTYKLADVALTGGDFTKATGDGGAGYRKVTIGAKSAVTIDTAGSATHVALCETAGSTLRYVTTCTTQYLVGGGTVDFPAWKVEMSPAT